MCDEKDVKYYYELFLSVGYSEEESKKLANLAEEAFAFYGDIDEHIIQKTIDIFNKTW